MTTLLNRQKQLAEQGRLRLGYVTAAKSGGMRPVASNTWIVTSHERLYVDTAAELWGGEPERWQPQGHGAEQWRVVTLAAAIDAFLPTGDPLSQAYEMWSAGGCQRRCDGVTEQFSGSPCLCAAQFGEEWYEQPLADICRTATRLKVILPDMPGIGSWRVETGSFYAADEIAGTLEVIRAAVGPSVLVPIRLRIEPRTRTKEGQTRQFIVPVVELRGVTAGALIAGTAASARQVEAAKQPAAIEGGERTDSEVLVAGTPEFYLHLATQADNLEELQAIWGRAARSGIPQADPLWKKLENLAQRFSPQPPRRDAPDQMWTEILSITGGLGFTLAQTEADFAAINEGVVAEGAGIAEMQRYLDHIRQVAGVATQ